MHIKVVGPCASGKSTLVAGLRQLGYDADSAAQDHSYVPDMWQRLHPPDLLIYLDLTLETAQQRGRAGLGWDQRYLDEQLEAAVATWQAALILKPDDEAILARIDRANTVLNRLDALRRQQNPDSTEGEQPQ